MKKENQTAIAIIILVAIVLFIYLSSKSGSDSTEPQAVKTQSGIPNLGDRSEAELLTDCQVDIQNKLSNPRSMDIIYSDLKYKKEVNHELWLQFYAKNQLNAESKHTGMCEFDDNGILLASKFE